jgi:hypothetical protein
VTKTTIPERLLPVVEVYRPGKAMRLVPLADPVQRRKLWRDMFWLLARGKPITVVPQYNPQLEAWQDAQREFEREQERI